MEAIAFMVLLGLVAGGFELYLRHLERKMKATVDKLVIWNCGLQKRFSLTDGNPIEQFVVENK